MDGGRIDGAVNDPAGNLDAGRTAVAVHGAAPLVLPLLHGAAGLWDEIFIFGGIAAILLGLAFLSWRSGQQRKRRRGARRK